MSVDLEAISAEFLNVCGPCDIGMPTVCTCAERDPRPVMLELVREITRLRDALNDLASDTETMPDDRVTPAMFAAAARLMRLILAGERP